MTHAISDAATTPGPLRLHDLGVEGVNQCVHCGLCLAYCPTFSELGTEMDSPRGRIFLIKSLAEGRIGLGDTSVRHLSLCLDCRACETVCPAGVPYGRLIEAARTEIERQRPGSILRRAFRVGTANTFIDRRCLKPPCSAARILAHAGWCLAKGLWMAAFGALRGRAPAAGGLRLAAFGIGRAAGLAGVSLAEYRHTDGH